MKQNIFFGLLVGLLLSTRNVFIIAYLICFIFLLKTKRIDFKNVLILGVITVFTFSLTFIPFIYKHFKDFKIANPFITENSLIPFQFSLMFVSLSVFVSFLCKKNKDVYFFSGLILFSTIVFYFGYLVSITSFTETFINSKADISYFILCQPFLIYYLIEGDIVN